MPGKPHDEVNELLKKWEEAYKKGLLSFWLFLLLYEQPAYAYELGARVNEVSQGTMSADEQSIYRALNRFQSIGLLKSGLMKSPIGPQRRYYCLTEKGTALLREFTRRNILVFEAPSVQERIKRVLQKEAASFKLEVIDDVIQT